MAPHRRVGKRAGEHHEVTEPPERGFDRVVVPRAEHRLRARLRRARDGVREGRRHLDLEPGHVADREAAHPARHHHRPERGAGQQRERDDRRRLAEDEHQRDEDDDRVEVVVEGQQPDVVVDHR